MTPSKAYAAGLSAATLIAGYIVAFVPSFGKEQKALISIGGIVIAAIILLADAVKNKTTTTTVEKSTEAEVRQILSTVDFGPVIQKQIVKLLGSSATTHDVTPVAPESPVQVDPELASAPAPAKLPPVIPNQTPTTVVSQG